MKTKTRVKANILRRRRRQAQGFLPPGQVPATGQRAPALPPRQAPVAST
jgi:hypothetical protein